MCNCIEKERRGEEKEGGKKIGRKERNQDVYNDFLTMIDEKILRNIYF